MRNLKLAALLVVLSTTASGNSSEKFDRLATDPFWLRLMHYKKSLFGGYKSKIDGQGYFFAENGQKDPRAEIEASYNALMDANLRIGILNQPVTCAFPIRHRFLSAHFPMPESATPCPELEEFISSFNPSKMSLVFSSAFPNSPASMFGHTFLRIHSEESEQGQKNPLLDNSLGFAAATGPDTEGLWFAVMGIFGGYRGQFARTPYYSKVQEYNDWNNRDLWEYELNLTREEIRTVLEHAWEIETTSHFDYYFFKENCSYQLLALLEVARPDWTLTEEAGFYVSPAWTIKAVTKIDGAVGDVAFKPSLRRRLYHRMSLLSKREKELAFQLADGDSAALPLASNQALDATSLFFSYVRSQDDGFLSDAQAAQQHAIHLQRSRRMAPSDSVDDSGMPLPNNRPEMGHGSYRVGIGGGWTNASPFSDLHFRTAYHDVLNLDDGYERFSGLDFPSIDLRISRTSFRVERATLVSVFSLFPMDRMEKRKSWRIGLDGYRVYDGACRECFAARLRSGIGVATNVLGESSMVYGMISGRIDASDQFEKYSRLGAEVKLAVLSQIQTFGKTELAAVGFNQALPTLAALDHYELSLTQTVQIGQNWELRAHFSRVASLTSKAQHAEGAVNCLYYFD